MVQRRRPIALTIGLVVLLSGLLVPGVEGAVTSLSRVAPFPVFTPKFAQFCGASTTGEAFSSAAVGDIDGDGEADIVAGFPDGTIQAWHINGTRFLTKQIGTCAVQASPALVDLNTDGVLDVLGADTSGAIVGFTGSGATLFSAHDSCKKPGCGIFGTPTAGDLDRDGELEVVASSWDHNIYAWNLDGSLVRGFPFFMYDTVWSSPALADLDGDGWLEIVVGGDCDGVPGQPCHPNRGGYVWVIRHDGTNQPGWPRFFQGQTIWSSPAIADVNGDGGLDVIVGTGLNFPGAGKVVLAYDRFARDLPGWPVAVGGMVMASPAIGDISGDGLPDVVTLADDGRVYAHDRSGGLLAGWPQCAANNRAACPVPLHASPVVADVDNDGRQEVVIGGEQWLRVFNGNGTLESEVPTVSGTAPLTAAPTVVSVNGKTWIVQVAYDTVASRGAVWVWTSGTALGGSPWPMFKQNRRRTGATLDEVPPVASLGPLDAIQSTTRVVVSWSGTDGDSGIAFFDVDVRDDTEGGGFVRWLNARSPTGRSGASASDSFAVFGFPGHSYTLRVRAVDRAGNVGAWSPTVTTSFAANATRVQPFTGAYAVNGFGEMAAISSPPAASGYPGILWAGWDIARGIAVSSDGRGGYVLDGWGGLHQFGNAVPVTNNPYFAGWDIARGVALNPDGLGGYVLDGWGALHPFGNATRVTNNPYFRGFDIARAVVLLPSSSAANPAGYVLDGYGGLHPFGSAPRVATTGYWPGWDIARAIALSSDGSGYVLDGWGGLHPFGGAAPVSSGGYWYGWDIARGAVSIGSKTSPGGYVLDGFGGIHPFGSAPSVESTRYWGRDLGRGAALAR